jgi:hypothetical protein
MLDTLCFSLQNAVYFIMLPFLVPVLFTLYIQVCSNLNVKLGCQKVNKNIVPLKATPLRHSFNSQLQKKIMTKLIFLKCVTFEVQMF